MTAVLIPTASEADWLAARRTGITASEIAIVMGLSPYSSPYALYHQKTGTLPDSEQSDAMMLGSYMEQFVADRFAERHPEFALSGSGRELYARQGRLWQMATPDRIVNDVRFDFLDGVSEVFEEHEPYAVLETKIDGGSDEWGEEGTGEIPVHYRCQVLWQCRVMGLANWYLAAFLWHRRQVRVYEGVIDEAAERDLALMEDSARDFLDRLDRREEPDVDWRPATTAALKKLHPSVEDRDVEIPRYLARRYRAACRSYKAAEQRKKLTENLIRARLGNGRRAITDDRHGPGDVIARRDVYDVKEHVRKASTVDKLVPVNPKEQKP